MSDAPVDTLQPTAPQDFTTQLLGPDCIAWPLQILLAGATLGMFASYTQTRLYREDTPWLKVLVWAVFLTNLASAGIGWAEVFEYTVSQKRDTATLYAYTVADCLAQLPQGLTAAMVQIFYAHRASMLSQKPAIRWCTFGVLVSIIFVSFLACIGGVVLSFQSSSGDPMIGGFDAIQMGSLWLWGSVASDLMITVLLYVRLRAQLLGPGMATNTIVEKVMRFSVATAMPTLLFALCGAIFTSIVIATPQADWGMIFVSPLPSVHTIVFIAVLNSRGWLRNELEIVQSSRGVAAPRSQIKQWTDRPPSFSETGSDYPPTQSHVIEVAVDVQVDKACELPMHAYRQKGRAVR